VHEYELAAAVAPNGRGGLADGFVDLPQDHEAIVEEACVLVNECGVTARVADDDLKGIAARSVLKRVEDFYIAGFDLDYRDG
jgi:hypothetical protein